jgi:hypothetical protein
MKDRINTGPVAFRLALSGGMAFSDDCLIVIHTKTKVKKKLDDEAIRYLQRDALHENESKKGSKPISMRKQPGGNNVS